MGLEPEDRKRLLLVGDVEGGLAKLYSQVVGRGMVLVLPGQSPKKSQEISSKNVIINQTAKQLTIFIANLRNRLLTPSVTWTFLSWFMEQFMMDEDDHD